MRKEKQHYYAVTVCRPLDEIPFTEDDIQRFFDTDTHLYGTVIERGVYNGERLFRLYLSHKYSSARILREHIKRAIGKVNLFVKEIMPIEAYNIRPKHIRRKR